MAQATNDQVQQFVTTQYRPFCEKLVQLKVFVDQLIASSGDVYSNLTGTPDWTDGITGNPAKLLTPADVLAINALAHNLQTAIEGDSAWGIAQAACINLPSIFE